MAKDLNSIQITGRLCADPELKYTASGIAVTSLRVAVNKMKPEDGQDADFINVQVWRQTAEFAANYLTKGRKVAVNGRLKIRPWVANDGTKRQTAEIVANELISLDRNPDQEQDGNGSYGPPTGQKLNGQALEPDPDFNDPFADQ